MKKILYIVSTLKRSGPIIVLANIVKYLDRNEFEPIVLTLSSEPKDSMKEYFEKELNTKVDTLGLSRVQGLFFAKNNIKKYIKDNNIDLVHTHGFRADGLISKIDIVKSVSTLHNYPYYDYPMTYGKIKGILMAKIHLIYLEKLTLSLACSKSIRDMLKSNKSYQINYLQNGTDTQRFQSLDKNILRKKLKIDKDKIVFVSVGHLSDRKDPITVIKAFEKSKINNAELIFLGDGHLSDDCKNISKDNSNIKFAGKVSNVEEYLGASDYLISASLAEGLPNTVLEAMACGLPCILSNIPPHVEIHEINQDSSLLFETKNINELSNKIKEIITKDYEPMSNAAKEIIYKNLSAEIMSKNYQKVYVDLLER